MVEKTFQIILSTIKKVLEFLSVLRLKFEWKRMLLVLRETVIRKFSKKKIFSFSNENQFRENGLWLEKHSKKAKKNQICSWEQNFKTNFHNSVSKRALIGSWKKVLENKRTKNSILLMSWNEWSKSC